jgi:hypothetical protein
MHSLLPTNSHQISIPLPDNAIDASIFASAAIPGFVHSLVFHLKMRTCFVRAHPP